MSKLGFIWDVLKTIIQIVSAIVTDGHLPSSFKVDKPDTDVTDIRVENDQMIISVCVTMDLVLSHEKKLGNKIRKFKTSDKSARRMTGAYRTVKGQSKQITNAVLNELANQPYELKNDDFDTMQSITAMVEQAAEVAKKAQADKRAKRRKAIKRPNLRAFRS